MSNQIQTFQGRQQAPVSPQAPRDTTMWLPSSIKNLTRKGVRNIQTPLPSNSGP